MRELDTGVMVFNNANGRLNELKDLYEPLFDQFFERSSNIARALKNPSGTKTLS